MRSLALLCIAVLLSAAPSFAAYTGLLIIPTAEVVGANQCCIEFEYDRPFASAAPTTRLLNTEFGFGDRLEAGVDTDFGTEPDEGARLLLNAKYLLPLTDRLSVAAGVFNTHPQHNPQSYVVFSQDATLLRLHGGVLHDDESTRWFTGADKGLRDRLTVMADYTSGDENFATAGFEYFVNDRLSVMGGLLFPNDHSKTWFSIHLIYSGPYR